MIWWTFLYLNALILQKDIKEKLIPNRLLLYLILLFPCYIYYNYLYHIAWAVNFIEFARNSIFIFICCFALFHTRIWWAWDAKYLLVLSLFIPHINFIVFIWNITLIIFCYLLFSYLYFYFSHIIRIKTRGNWLWSNILLDLKNKCKHFVYNTSFKKISINLWLFALIFISIRMYRVYAFGFFLDNSFSITFLITVCILLCSIIWCCYIIYKRYSLRNPYVYPFFILCFSVLFVLFFSYEYTQDKEKIIDLLYKVFTVYFFIFLLIKVLKYTVHVYAWQDYYLKSPSNLEVNDIIERSDFNKKVLPLIQNNKNILNYYDIPLYWNIIVNSEIKDKLPALIRSINKNNTKAFKGSSVIADLKCMKTFALAPYLFLWFLTSFLFGKTLLNNIYDYISLFLLK